MWQLGGCLPGSGGCEMAGRPKRRALREQAAGRREQFPEFPERSKPVAEMTEAERQEYTRDLRRFLRDAKKPQREAGLRAGRIRPRTQREVEIFASDLLGRRTVGDRQDPGDPA
jgi:hypothetical protein